MSAELLEHTPDVQSTRNSAYTIEDQERMTRAKNYFAWQHRLVAPHFGRRVVEVGCGVGNFTGTLLDCEIVVAVDVEPGCIARLRQRYSNRSNLHAFAIGADTDAFCELARFSPDSCVCLNVLEHVADDRQALLRMASILVPGGVVVLLVPAFPALYGPIDRNLEHYRRYTRKSITALAGAAKLRIKEMHFLNIVGFFAWWVNAHLLRREAQSEAQIEFFDRYIVPAMSRFESLVHPPLGQSLFVVLDKP
jgi:2-polyprenyl-3-methyl-5-hydroxy-6-metoxy-1,4-benzoquinol methylase